MTADLSLDLTKLVSAFGWWAFVMLFLLVVAQGAADEVGPHLGALLNAALDGAFRAIGDFLAALRKPRSYAVRLYDWLVTFVGLDERDEIGLVHSPAEQKQVDGNRVALRRRSTAILLALRDARRYTTQTWLRRSLSDGRFGIALRLLYAAETSVVYGIGAALLVPAASRTSLFSALTGAALGMAACAIGHGRAVRRPRLFYVSIVVVIGVCSIVAYSGWNGRPGTAIDAVGAVLATVAVILVNLAVRRGTGWRAAKRAVIATLLAYTVANFVNLFYLPRVARYPWLTVVLASTQLVSLGFNALRIRHAPQPATV